MKFSNLELLAQTMPTWALFLTLDNAGNNAPCMDALDFAVSADTDALDACEVDSVAYHEIDALASLDDEIDDEGRTYTSWPNWDIHD